MMEAFSDGFGGWRFLPGPATTLLEQSFFLMEDLLTWRVLARKIETQNRMKKEGARKHAGSSYD